MKRQGPVFVKNKHSIYTKMTNKPNTASPHVLLILANWSGKKKLQLSMLNHQHSSSQHQDSQAVYTPSSLPSFVNPRACAVRCTHISQHMTCRSHLMKLSGNECSGLMTEEGGTTPATTIHSLLCATGWHFFSCLHCKRKDKGHVPTQNSTSPSDTSPDAWCQERTEIQFDKLWHLLERRCLLLNFNAK